MGHGTSSSIGTRAKAAIGAIASCLFLLALSAPVQAASFEQVGCFAGGPAFGLTESCQPVEEEKFTEEVQLGSVSGMAVNYTGAGVVPKGTVYAMVQNFSSGNSPQVAMFVPKPGGLKFAKVWRVASEAGKAYFSCGPLLGTELLNGEEVAKFPCPPGVGGVVRGIDVDVDQATGKVYVRNGNDVPGREAVVVYTPDGSEEITRFGEQAPLADKIAESPEKVHRSGLQGGIAVGKSGEVYFYDEDNTSQHRLMVFRPNGLGEYEYAGTGEDVGVANSHRPTMPVADAAGNLYVASNSTFVEEYDPTHPGNPPVCTFKYEKGRITSITVDPLSGEPYFYSGRIVAGFTNKTVHRLGPCNPATHKFEGPKGEEEMGQFEVTPERDELTGLAFDPVDMLEATRPAGILYGGAPSQTPPVGFGNGAPDQSSLGYVFAPQKAQPVPPAIEAESVSRVTATSAGLHATIDPKGIETSYAFQYVTEAAYEANEPSERFAGATEAPPGGAPLQGGTSKGGKSATATVTGLVSDTAYRYRAVAKSKCDPLEPEKTCVVTGATRRFHTYPATAPGLPDDRVWELVSPAQKNGGQVLPADPRLASCGSEVECKPGTFSARFPMQSAPSGDEVAYEGTAFGSGGASLENSYIARRTSTGWESANPTPALLRSKGGGGYRAFAEDLSEGVLAQEKFQSALSPQAPPGYEDLYVQPTGEPLAIKPLLTAGLFAERPLARSVDEFGLGYAGSSSDLARVFFAANDALTAKTATAPAASDGGVLKPNLYEWHEGQLALVNVAPGNATSKLGAAFGAGSAHAISTDGSRTFFSDETGAVFVREDAKTTLAIPGSGAAAKFLAAATDGSKVLLSNGRLYNLETKTTTDLTAGKGGFQGLVGQSDDLTHAYFVDTAVLTGAEENCREGSGAEVCEAAQAGNPNLYDWNAGTTHFVARLDARDNGGGSHDIARSWDPVPSNRTAEASPQGHYLAFLSQAPLTGFDSTGPCETDHAGGFVQAPCPEVFLYDSVTEKLACPSCNPSGAPTFGWSLLRLIKSIGTNEWAPQARYLTDSGRLYFDSQDSLSPLDTNEGVEDVYQYEPQGVGSCKREGGCVSLISAGTESVDSNFLAADPSGKNVFFTTRDRLTLRDKDELLDLYDAREGGGIPAETETGRGECQGEACQPPVVVPNDPTPASSGFEGAGNVTEQPTVTRKPCAKGKVKRRGKCVPRHRKHRRATRHHRRAHR